MKILEELWYGNIEPTEYGTSPSQEYRELRRLVDRNETNLRASMTDAQKELFTRYLESVLEYQTLSELMLFQNSFRLGARLMVEVMEE
ncbi:MAG: hypothetical protein IJD99_06155 [Clostridia bacterium]|nr:hypothetical protein [Clostridia bacterium]